MCQRIGKLPPPPEVGPEPEFSRLDLVEAQVLTQARSMVSRLCDFWFCAVLRMTTRPLRAANPSLHPGGAASAPHGVVLHPGASLGVHL